MTKVNSQTVHKLALKGTEVTFYAQSERDRVNVVVSYDGRKQPYSAHTRDEARDMYKSLVAKGYADPSKPVVAPVAAAPKRQRKAKAAPVEAAVM